MAQFRVSNLMIDVASAEIDGMDKLCLIPTNCGQLFTKDCPWLTFVVKGCLKDATLVGCFISDGCGLNYSTCWAGSRTYVIDLERLVSNPGDIDAVKGQMREVFAKVKEGAREIDAGPQTFEQAEALEQALEGALDEVRKAKRRLG